MKLVNLKIIYDNHDANDESIRDVILSNGDNLVWDVNYVLPPDMIVHVEDYVNMLNANLSGWLSRSNDVIEFLEHEKEE